jgi:RNA polymerase sigma-70 factor (ECF subfamily)
MGRRQEEPAASVDETAQTVRDAALDAMDRMGTGWALALIATLPKDQAEAVLLRVVAGLDVAQTAAVLGKRPGAVRVAAMRGLRRLAATIEQPTDGAEQVPPSSRVALSAPPHPEGV